MTQWIFWFLRPLLRHQRTRSQREQSPTRQLLRTLLLGMLMLGGGAAGYRLLGWPWLDAWYMATLTATTVGYGEVYPLTPIGKLFTIALMLLSIGVFAYAISTLTATVVELHLGHYLRRRTMNKRIARLNGHIIVCGYGRGGQSVCEQLQNTAHPFVVVERQQEEINSVPRAKDAELLFVHGSADQDEVLLRAGIQRAKGVALALGNDAQNLYAAISVRSLNPQVKIAAWWHDREAHNKIHRAGVDFVVLPYRHGGMRMAHLLVGSTESELVENLFQEGLLFPQQVSVAQQSSLVGRSVAAAAPALLRNAIFIALRRNGTTQRQPDVDTPLQAGDEIVFLADNECHQRLRALCLD